MKLFCSYLRSRVRSIAAYLLFLLIFSAGFVLYRLPVEAVLYPAFLCGLAGACFILGDFLRVRRRHRRLAELAQRTAGMMDRRRGLSGDHRISPGGSPNAGDRPGDPGAGHRGILHRVGAPDQNAHRGHAAHPAKRGFPAVPEAQRRSPAHRAVCGDGAHLFAAGFPHQRLRVRILRRGWRGSWWSRCFPTR